MGKTEKEEGEKRLGWILAELGAEDAEVERLEKNLKMHRGRITALERASKYYVNELGLDKPITIKDHIRKFLKKFIGFLPLMGIGISLFMIIHSLWQLDLICVAPVWFTNRFISEFLESGLRAYSDQFFKCGPLETHVGFAYDLFLSEIVVAWFLLLLSMYFGHWKIVEAIRRVKSFIRIKIVNLVRYVKGKI